MGYLIWYNGERPHSGLQQVSPIKYLYYAIKKYYKVSKDMDLYIVLKILKISLSCI
ncbi:transposase [Caldimicrobium thiodismutans]|uniref:transposase n=1 Tax=Caldimicrobium thiodismutans TaxID=1653476 RepID=UPI001E368357|nr:transposase [Caldimicrobium thiodismutans]